MTEPASSAVHASRRHRGAPGNAQKAGTPHVASETPELDEHQQIGALAPLAAARSVSIRKVSRPAWASLVVGAVLLSSAAASFGSEHSRPALVASAIDLHKVDWASVTLPGSVCGASKPIRLHRGSAFITPVPRRFSRDSFPGRRGVTVDTAPDAVIFGDLEGSGSDDAGLAVNCNNGGGTADGALLYAWAIFSGRGGRLSVVGVVTPQVQPAEELPTLIEVAIRPGKITASESFYGPADATCCSSGRATTIWTYAHRMLLPGVPVITRRPTA
jgi:hypothetical protein